MYKILTVHDVIRVPPEKLGKNVKEAIIESIEEKYEGLIDPKLGVILACVSVNEIKEGKIRPTDPGVYYEVIFDLLVYKPELHELVFGEVVENAEFGAFVRIGPLDGLVHISQLMDDFVSYDAKNRVFLGRESKKTLKEKDLVLARVISLSFAEQTKLGLTMRQPGLGSLNWLEAEKKKRKGK